LKSELRLLRNSGQTSKVTEFSASTTTPALFQSGQLNRWSAAEVSDLSVVTLLNGPQEIPTLPDHPFDRNTPFFKSEQHYSLYSISLIQFSRWKTESNGQLIVVPAKTPDGHSDRSNGRSGFAWRSRSGKSTTTKDTKNMKSC
jgi:hypothetical protein